MKKFNTTVGKLYEIEQSIISTDIMNMPFSRKGGLSVYRNMRKFEAELEDYKKDRADLIKCYSGGKDSINPESENWAVFVEAYNDLSSVEVSVEINTIACDDLPEQTTPVVCGILDFMIDDSDKKEEE